MSEKARVKIAISVIVLVVAMAISYSLFREENKTPGQKITVKKLDSPYVDFFYEPSKNWSATSTEADLNNDGRPETITLRIKDGYGGYWAEATLLTVNQHTVLVPGQNPDGSIGIVDIDTRDNLKEIAIGDTGPSSDYTTSFYTYDGNNIVTIATISGSWQRMKFDGFGGLTTRTRGQVLDTWFYDDNYKLSRDHFLMNIPRSFYERLNETPLTLLQSFTLQKSPTDTTITLALEKGDRVNLLGCDNIAWCKIEDQNGVDGWFSVHDYDILTGPELRAQEVFAGLTYAD